MNRVLLRSTAPSTALICAGSVLSSMWKRGQPCWGPKVSPIPPAPGWNRPSRAAQSLNPRCFTSAAKPRSRSYRRAPAPRRGASPSIVLVVPVHSAVAGPEPPDAPVLAPGLHFTSHSFSSPESPSRSPGSRVALEQRAAPGDSAKQFIESVRELLHPVLDQFFRDLIQRDAMLFQLRETALPPASPARSRRASPHRGRETHPSSPAGWCPPCRGRSAPRHTCILVGRILVLVEAQSSRCALRRLRQRCHRGAGEQSLVAGVCELRVGDRRLPRSRSASLSSSSCPGACRSRRRSG